MQIPCEYPRHGDFRPQLDPPIVSRDSRRLDVLSNLGRGQSILVSPNILPAGLILVPYVKADRLLPTAMRLQPQDPMATLPAMPLGRP